MSYSLGVDLGTTFVAAALATATKVEMFTLGNRSVVSPAAVYLTEDGTLLTGDAAMLRVVTSPDRVCREFKRRLGNPTPVTLGGQPYPVTTLLAALLRDVLEKVTQTQGEPPETVLLTHPANWGPFRRALFEEVPPHAGLQNPPLVTEPEAAAAHYAASKALAEGETVAVYDLGGGTFDATVLRQGPERVEILGTPEGIERLGGVDFDEAILSYVDYAAGGTLSELDMGDPKILTALARLRQDCIQAKEALSVDTETTIPVFLPSGQFDVRLTRSDFEDLVRAQIETTIGALSRTLESAQVTPAELSAVLLIGGSSRIPLVTRMVAAELGCPTVVDTHPKHAVALGAAALAARAGQAARPIRAVAAQPGAPPSAAEISIPPPAIRSSSPPPGERTRRRHRRLAQIATGIALLLLLILIITVKPFKIYTMPSGSSAPTPAVRNTAAIRVGQTPGFVAVAPNGRQAYITDRDAHAITMLDTATHRVSATIPVPAGPPQFLAVAPDGRRLYVSLFNNQGTIRSIAVLDTASNKLIATIPQPARPFQPAITPDGKYLWVPHRDNATVSVIDTATNTVIAQIQVAPNPRSIEFAPDGTRAYTAHESNVISVIDTASRALLATISVGARPYNVAVNPSLPLVANVNYQGNTVSEIDTATWRVVATIPVGTKPRDIVWAPDGQFAYVANEGSNDVSVIDARTNQVIATIPIGRPPSSIALTPNAQQAYVTNPDRGTVTVLDLTDN